jgi:hypothetical protein
MLDKGGVAARLPGQDLERARAEASPGLNASSRSPARRADGERRVEVVVPVVHEMPGAPHLGPLDEPLRIDP